ncbi:carboxypeptidase-like regulatory domain-containing protein [Streptomyces murinus]|uniref:carboxypeptidase-like regulatory domain-containing protein n=1 Tax=Streptomyces murinus TaxID=33900 RepID=UPI0034021A98
MHRHRFGEPEPDLLGTVTDSHGRPVPRTLVTVLDPGGRQLVSTLTNAHGEYAATGLPEGCLSVVATLPVVQQRPPRRGRTGGLPAAGPRGRARSGAHDRGHGWPVIRSTLVLNRWR